jgi:O-methyltransferase involved in polyketide biosynthesis
VLGQGDIETVVNLGAGLDTRPWRLDLPARLRWIEVDFQDILDYKAERLRAEPPRCTLEQVAADLSVSSDRERVFRAVGSRSALMLTEGLLMYLSKDALAALALEAVTNSGIRRWIFDISSNELMRRVHGDELKDIDSVRAKDHLTGSEIIEVALSHGWKTGELRSYTHDVITIARDRILELISSTGQPPEPPPENDPSGVYLLHHK